MREVLEDKAFVIPHRGDPAWWGVKSEAPDGDHYHDSTAPADLLAVGATPGTAVGFFLHFLQHRLGGPF